MSDDVLPRCPDHLEKAGRRLWKAVLTTFELRPDELLLLEAGCRLADQVAALEWGLADAPLMVEGSKGQERPHPLYAEIRAHRLAVARIMAQLGLADAVDADGATRSSAGRRMARARWSGR
jgi:phage terminase small subunit